MSPVAADVGVCENEILRAPGALGSGACGWQPPDWPHRCRPPPRGPESQRSVKSWATL